MNLRAFLVLIAVGAIAAAGWWVQELIRPEPGEPAARKEKRPDYFLEEFTATTTNDQGQPHYRLTAKTMAHYARDDRADLQDPIMVFFRPEGPAVHMRSETGTVLEQGALVHLEGKVLIDRPPSPANREVHVITRNLTVHPDQNYAETAEPVRIEREASTLQGVGMQAWLADGRMRLLSQVRGTYEPVEE
ncbi:MAG: LPS export ABC transporter periplasmic protein LptC [Gammaproteobacteria bacterium]|nr:LPS export ABC transporter periplasmic protein LptC [Gammaproteobacteria bacterium]NIR98812.1 LPS export ABC transporter periplasmic protein LptC [Gammaproteobacteria bacterium]NIT64522.1 LPS export ABC transporter periplasmic protein LptC [Gammaproteobacteria bacterium]NIV21442.1 LPS export ABC transporter periplasmic protein LptC [Gammaproteobacteria bacterium]NIX11312.1 LPS export ABC transporter periplasmic protein LptC [Gammaproteobacteria bacterium]